MAQPNMNVDERHVIVIGEAIERHLIVVGEAITDRDYPSKNDRARAACQRKDSVSTKISIQETIVTNCAIYNASGDSMKIICFKDWNGQAQTSYPQEIGNGQWGLFVHTKKPMVPEGSKAAVVYRVKDENGNESDWMCSWNNPRKREQSSTHAYTEVREVDHFTDNMWPIISKKTDEAGHESTDTEHGWLAEVSITEGSLADYDAVITLFSLSPVSSRRKMPQPNMDVNEGHVTVIGEAITARDYALKKDRARAANQQKDTVCTKINLAANFQETAVTKGSIYNATGDAMYLVGSKDWNGQPQTPYPQKIENGQVGLFMHTTRQNDDEGSKGAVVYRVKDENGNESDWMWSWNNPRKREQSSTHAYTEVREVNHFTDNMWPIISKKTDEAGHESTDTEHGWVAVVSITEGSPADYDAVITLPN